MKKIFIKMYLVVSFVIVYLIIIVPSLNNHIRNLSKKYIFYNVDKKQEELSELIGRYVDKDQGVFIHLYREDERAIPYKKMHDEEMSNIFKEFHLMVIKYDENGNIFFYVYPYVGLFIEGYSNGFYYSVEDKPIGGKGEEIDDLEVEYDSLNAHKWYKTEQIADYWWYFEEILTIE